MTVRVAPTDSRSGQLPVTLRPVTVANWQECIHLRLAPEQSRRIASNLYSLAEAYVEPQCTPRAIYAGEQMIGFVMTEHNAAKVIHNIPRFMIDVAWQGAGYGGRALQAIVDRLKAEQPEAPILISLTPDNTAARRLYERHGFEPTGQRAHGEDVLRHPGTLFLTIRCSWPLEALRRSGFPLGFGPTRRHLAPLLNAVNSSLEHYMKYMEVEVRTASIVHGFDDENKEIIEEFADEAFIKKLLRVDRIQSVSEQYLLVTSSHGRVMYWEYRGSLAEIKSRLEMVGLLVA